LRHTLEVNLVAVFHLSQIAGRMMLERGAGSIINIASIHGLVAGWPIAHSSYCASKGAVVSLTRQLGTEWASRGVRVNAIAPGWFESGVTAWMWNDDRSIRFVEQNTPARRRGREDEIDGVLLLLAGDGGSFISGQTIAVDGGWSSH